MAQNNDSSIVASPFNPQFFYPEAVIVANGELPSLPLMRQWLSDAPFTVCCDGAVGRFPLNLFRCDLVIGDGDSFVNSSVEGASIPFVRISEQETNDLTKAVAYLQQHGKNRAVILGATGRRTDHMIGNISLLVQYLRNGFTAFVIDDYGMFIPCKDNVELYVGCGRQISVFRFDATGMRATNLKYPLRDFDMLWQGTLNEATDDMIQIHAHGYYLLYLAN